MDLLKLKAFADRLEERIIGSLGLLITLSVRSTVWIIYVAGYIVSAMVFLRWIIFSFDALVLLPFSEVKALLHTLLLLIELLILVPVPAIVGVVIFRTLRSLGASQTPDPLESGGQVHFAERLLVSLLITLTGTTLLDALITQDGGWERYLGGCGLILALSLFLWLNEEKHPDKPRHAEEGENTPPQGPLK